MVFGVDLPCYYGPLELLFYLVRREELPLEELSLGKITHQYMEYLDVMQELSLDVAGEFMVMAATLIHIKVNFHSTTKKKTIRF